ncbi:MAG: N-acetylmuramoyl-L-alanine amidase [Phycisphaerales bacterium]|nr:N-acetylmuramoyl-L-alanine amidase [Phycisphaerales bacterium]
MNPPTRHQGRSPILGLAAGLLVTLTLGMPVRAAVPARVAAALAEAHAAGPMARVTVATNALAGDVTDAAFVPEGTVVDRAEWADQVCRIDLTFPSGTPDAFLADGRADTLAETLAQVAAEDGDTAGAVIRARIGSAGDYRPLDDFRFSTTAPQYVRLVEDAAPAQPLNASAAAAPTTRTGPVGNAGHQPEGALSGVVVYATAGHGWTAGSSSWFLQRPLLLNMIEDYGNLDQLNYFVNYAFNAGATVVAFRPIGYQPIEVVLDQDDPGVTYTGGWTNSSSSPYYENGVTNSGVAYRFAATSATETATARYTPNLPEAGFYPVYTWVLNSSNRTTQHYRVTHSGGTTEVVVDHRMVGRGWVWLGTYYFDAGTAGYVEISNQSADGGNVIADGIRFGNGIGDVVGAGPGTVSGYPRDEEAQRYWAESETAHNAVGMPSNIYNCCTDDDDDNVGTGARWGKEMNETDVNADRWRRIYIEFHSNAGSGTTKGTVALVTGSPTTYQTEYATILGDEIEQDMQILDGSEFEYTWGSRTNPYNGAFGAISTSNNSNEFDATILEVAFHDNAEDAALLLDPKVRNAVARSSIQGIVKFLHTLPGSAIALNFLPTEPRHVRAVHNGTGGVVISWDAPVTGEAYGGAATGYRVYRSTNGYGFDAGTDVGNVLSTTLLDVPAHTTTFFRVAAYNAGGESMPSATVAVRRSSSGTAGYLIVNGFDRVGRSQDPRQTLPGVGTQRRPILRKVNSFDYVVQHADALADAGAYFDSCENDNVILNDVALGDYGAVVWMLGEESTADHTFDATEQSRVTAYLNGGGNLFVSGAEIGWDLDAQGNGASFYNNELKANYAGDDANTYNVAVSAGSIFAGIGAFSFDDGTLYYDTEYPDQLAPFGGSTVALTYVGGSGGNAAVVYDGAFKVVNFGFPFETITNAARRSELMDAVVTFFGVLPPTPTIVDLVNCLSGPGGGYLLPECADVDFDTDVDVDLVDFQLLQQAP